MSAALATGRRMGVATCTWVLLSGAAAAETIRALGTPPGGHTSTLAMERLAEGLAKTTLGRLEIELQPGATAAEVIDALARGDATLGWLPIGELGAVAGVYDVLALPFLFQDRQELARALDDQGLGPLLNDELRKRGVVALVYMTGDDLHLASSAGPVTELDGRRIGIFPGEMRQAVFDALAAETVSLDEARAEVDLYEATLADVPALEGLDVTARPHALGELAVVANIEAFDELPIDLQELLGVRLEETAAWQAGASETARADAEADLRDAGVTFFELSEQARAAGRAAAVQAVEATDDLGPPSIIEAILAEAM